MRDQELNTGRWRSERGVALPAAVTALFTMLLLVSGAAAVTRTNTSQSERDKNTKKAVAAADAGIQTTIYRLNTIRPETGNCLKQDSSTGFISEGTTAAGEWCNGVTQTLTETLPDGASYRAQITRGVEINGDCQTTEKRKIVSVGTSSAAGTDNVRERVLATVGTPASGSGYKCALIGKTGVTFGGKGRVYGDVATDQSLIRNTESVRPYQAGVCGDIFYGSLGASSGDFLQLCDGTALRPKSTVTCNGVDTYCIPEVASTCKIIAGDMDPAEYLWRTKYNASTGKGCNSNQLICGPTAAQAPGVCTDKVRLGAANNSFSNTCNATSPPTSGSCWDQNSRVLALHNGASLTLTGNIYSFCSITLRGGTGADGIGSQLIVAPRNGGQTIIEIDSPDDCNIDPNSSYSSQVKNVADVGGGIKNLNSSPTSLVMLVRGATNPAVDFAKSTVELASSFSHDSANGSAATINSPEYWTPMVVKAPKSNVVLAGDARVLGAVWAGGTVRIEGGGGDSTGARVAWHDDVGKLDAGGVLGSTFTMGSWAQCARPSSVAPADLATNCTKGPGE